MKNLKLILIGFILFFASAVQSQVAVNVNIGTPPPWGPVGYNEVRYYYLPDVEAYYDIQSSMFIYYYGGAWIHRSYLPVQYRSYDLFGGYKVVMTDYYGNTPYIHFKNHKMKYAKGYHGKMQKTIGNRHEKVNNGNSGNNRGNNSKSKRQENNKNMKNKHNNNGKGNKK